MDRRLCPSPRRALYFGSSNSKAGNEKRDGRVRSWNIEFENRQIALLSQEGSGIAKRIPRGVVPKPRYCRFTALEPPRRFAPPLLTQEGNFLSIVPQLLLLHRNIRRDRWICFLPVGLKQ